MTEQDYYNPSLLKFKSVMGGPFDSQTPLIIAPNQGMGTNLPQINDRPTDFSQYGAPDKDTFGQSDEITKLVSKLYTPGHEIADKFNEVWNQMPQREKPSMLRRIVASMVGAGGGPKAASEVIDAPYNEAMADWTTKLKMLQPLLGEERYSNTNERMLATNAATTAVQMGRNAETERYNREKTRIADEKLELDRKKQELAELLRSDPDYELENDQATGKVYAVNKKNPTQKLDTGLTFDNFSELQKAQWRLKAAQAPRTIFTTSSGTTTTTTPPESQPPSQQKVARYLAAQDAFNKNPEWRPYIHLADPGTNEYTVDAPNPGTSIFGIGPFGKGADQSTIDAINKYIDDNSKTSLGGSKTTTTESQSSRTSGGPGTVPPKATPKSATPATKGIRVRDRKTGQTGTWTGTEEQLDKNQFEVIKDATKP